VVADLLFIFIGVIIFAAFAYYVINKVRPFQVQPGIAKDTDKTLRTTIPIPAYPPALAARFLRLNKTPILQVLMATLMDFARRGLITFQTHSHRTVFGTLSSDNYITYHPNNVDLHPFEQYFIETLLMPPQREKSLTSLMQQSKQAEKEIFRTIDSTLANDELISIEKIAQRRRLQLISYALFILAFIICVILLSQPSLSSFTYSIPLGILASAFISLWGSNSVPVYTEKGNSAILNWQRFERYLAGIPKQEAAPHPSLVETFSSYLPYAIAFDLGMQWIVFFILQKKISKPAWFPGVEGGGGLFSFLMQRGE